MPVETTSSDNPETPYERLVEYVGHGSVTQVRDGGVYIIDVSNLWLPDTIVPDDKQMERARARHIKTGNSVMMEYALLKSYSDHFSDRYDDFIMTDKDLAGTWVIIGSEESTTVGSTTLFLLIVSALLLLLLFGLLL